MSAVWERTLGVEVEISVGVVVPFPMGEGSGSGLRIPRGRDLMILTPLSHKPCLV